MKRGRKGGLVLEVLLGIIIASLFFFAACSTINKALHGSFQAQTNAQELAAEIMSVGEGVKSPFVLTADEKTFLAAFSQNEKVFVDTDDKGLGTTTHTQSNPTGGMTTIQTTTYRREKYYLSYPQKECEGKDCLCLCRKYTNGLGNYISTDTETEGEGTSNIKHKVYEITEVERFCTQLSCYVLNGVELKESWGTLRKEGGPRRVDLLLENVGGMLSISGGYP